MGGRAHDAEVSWERRRYSRSQRVMCDGRCRASISLGLSAFVVYTTWAAFQRRIIVSGALTFYSLELFGWRAIITRASTINRCGPTQRS